VMHTVLEKFDPSNNVEIIQLPGYEHSDDPQEVIQSITSIIEVPFHSVAEVINPQRSASAIMSNLLSSPSTPLCTALVLMLSSSPSSLERLLIDTLGPLIPIILLPRLLCRTSTTIPNLNLSSFQPTSIIALRRGLFRSPDTLTSLRAEAADRFLRWREIERAIDDLSHPVTSTKESKMDWSKKEFEAEWESMLSEDVARTRRSRDRDNTITQANSSGLPHHHKFDPPYMNTFFDPLHIPSLVVFSFSLLRPARRQLGISILGFVGKLKDWEVGLALVGSFCFGIGLGLLLK